MTRAQTFCSNNRQKTSIVTSGTPPRRKECSTVTGSVHIHSIRKSKGFPGECFFFIPLGYYVAQSK